MLDDVKNFLKNWERIIPREAKIELDILVAKWSLPTLTDHPGATSEAATQNRLRLNAPDYGGYLWRNNNGACFDDRGNYIRYGLANDSKKLNEVFKSSDLIGVTPVKIEQHHIGRTMGIFTAVEVKKPGWNLIQSDKRGHGQLNFINTVRGCGGIAIFASHEDHFKEGLTRWLG